MSGNNILKFQEKLGFSEFKKKNKKIIEENHTQSKTGETPKSKKKEKRKRESSN